MGGGRGGGIPPKIQFLALDTGRWVGGRLEGVDPFLRNISPLHSTASSYIRRGPRFFSVVFIGSDPSPASAIPASSLSYSYSFFPLCNLYKLTGVMGGAKLDVKQNNMGSSSIFSVRPVPTHLHGKKNIGVSPRPTAV
jgi:hypothetical protein